MRTTVDGAGRLVIPKVLRDLLGITAGPVEIVVDGSGLRIQPVRTEDLDRSSGRAVIPASGLSLGDDHVRRLRNADQRYGDRGSRRHPRRHRNGLVAAVASELGMATRDRRAVATYRALQVEIEMLD